MTIQLQTSGVLTRFRTLAQLALRQYLIRVQICACMRVNTTMCSCICVYVRLLSQRTFVQKQQDADTVVLVALVFFRAFDVRCPSLGCLDVALFFAHLDDFLGFFFFCFCSTTSSFSSSSSVTFFVAPLFRFFPLSAIRLMPSAPRALALFLSIFVARA
jgi:hypothetical protein